MLPRDCFPKIADWIEYIYIYIYIVSKENKPRDYTARWKNARRADCFLVISCFVELEKGRENIKNI